MKDLICSNKLKKALFCLFWVAFMLIIFVPKSYAAAGINKTINFQGKVVNKTAGTNVTDGTYTMIFKIYDKPSGGTQLWTETDSVGVTDGIFRVALGSGTPFPAGMNWNQDGLFLDITFNSEAMGSRVQLTAVPYAFNAGQVAGLTVQDSTSGAASTSATLKLGDATTPKTFDLGTNSLSFTTSGTTTLTLPTSGTVTALGNTTTGSGTTLVLSSNPSFTGITLSSGAITLGGVTGSGLCLTGGATASWGSCGSGGGTSYWNLNPGGNTGIITPINSKADLLIGSQATSSALFSFTGLSNLNHQTQASISGNLNVYANNGFGGNVLVPNGYIGVGGTSTNSSIYGTSNPTNKTFFTSDTYTNASVTSNGSYGIRGLESYVDLAASANDTDTNYGVMAGSFFVSRNSGTGTVNLLRGTYTNISNNSGTITNLIGSDITLANNSGTTTTAYGARIGIANTGTLTTAYGLYLDTIAGTTKYGLYQSDTTNLNYFGGKLGIGTAPATTNGQLYVSRPLASGAIGKSVATFDQIENQDIFTASKSGTPKFIIGQNGEIGLGLSGGVQNFGSASNCLISGGTGASASWGSCGSGSGLFTDAGTFSYLTSTTDDLVLGSSTVAGGSLFFDVSAGSLYLGTNESLNGSLTLYSSGVGVSDPTITTDSSGNLNLASTQTGSSVVVGSGTGNIVIDPGASKIGVGLTSPTGMFHVTRALTNGATGKALAVFDQIENQDILTASKGGTTRFTIDQNGQAVITSTGSNALAIGRQGSTNPVLNVDASTTSVVTGLNIKGAAAAGGLALSTTSSGTNENLTIDAKGSGSITLGGNSTGAIQFFGSSYNINSSGALTVSSCTGCGGSSGLSVRSFIDTTSDSVVDANTTDYWDNSAENNNSHPNITPSSTSKSIYGVLTMETTGSSTSDVEITARVEENVGSVPTCNSGTQVGGKAGTFSSNSGAVKTSTTSFLDSPSTTSTVYYAVCSDTATVGTSGSISRLRMSLFEVDNSNADIAELYSTNDPTLEAGDVVSLDPSLKEGVKKSAGLNDKSVFGIVSTSPAIVMGGASTEGVTSVALALAGRVPVKVSTESGEIKPGDYLTTSSVPGVAMKATKAGSIIGQAMEGFDGASVGSILVFVKNTQGMGAVADLPAQDILKSLTNGSSNVNSGMTLSGISADRIVAGLELITPHVVAQKGDFESLNVNDATISGVLNVDLLRANKIEGLDFLTDRISLLDSKIASISAVASPSAIPQIPIASFSAAQNPLISLNPNGSAVLEGDLRVKKGGLFEGVLTVLDTIITKDFIANGLSTFLGDVVFKQNVAFSNNYGGYALIKKNDNSVVVKFSKSFENPPIINANLLIEEGDGDVSSQQNILNQKIKYYIKNPSEKGFVIALTGPAVENMKFSWSAISVENPSVSQDSRNASLSAILNTNF